MAGQPHQASQEPQAEMVGCLPALLRLTWMALGNMALFFCAVLVAKGTAPVVDIVLFALVVGLVVVRYVDITWFKGQTAEGKPATLRHWRRHAALLVVISTALWALARLVASRGWM